MLPDILHPKPDPAFLTNKRVQGQLSIIGILRPKLRRQLQLHRQEHQRLRDLHNELQSQMAFEPHYIKEIHHQIPGPIPPHFLMQIRRTSFMQDLADAPIFQRLGFKQRSNTAFAYLTKNAAFL